MVIDILEKSRLADWEETTLGYCRLMLIKSAGGADASLICSDEKWRKSAAVRYLKKFNIRVTQYIDIGELKKSGLRLDSLAENELVISCCGNWFFDSNGNRIARGLKKYLFRRGRYRRAEALSKRVIPLNFPYWRQRREELYMYALEHSREFDELAALLADDESRATLYEMLRCGAEHDVYAGPQGSQDDKYWECYKHKEDEIWVNCGSAVGDTIIKYLDGGFSYSKIYAYEGSEKEFRGLKEIVSQIDDSRIEICNEFIGIDASEENFDHRFADIPVSLINMDIEGAETGVLRGAKQIIAKWRPVLAVCTYHKVTDLLEIPRLISEAAGGYAIYLRKYRGYEPNALNEYLYYAVPDERKV